MKVVQSPYPLEAEKQVNAAISKIHREGGFVSKVTVLGDYKNGFVASIIFEDNIPSKKTVEQKLREHNW